MFKSQLSILSSAFLFVACASAPQIKTVPADAKSGGEQVVPLVLGRMPELGEKYASTDIEETYFGVSGASGSLAVGLLFGALGALGNASYVKSENTKHAAPLTTLTSQNLSQLLKQAEPSLTAVPAGSQATYELVPSATIFFKSDTAYWLTCQINAVKPGPKGVDPWRARYAISTEGIFDSSSQDDSTRAIESLGPCLSQAYQLFAKHVSNELGTFEKKTITVRSVDGSKTLDQEYLVAVSELPNRVVVNDFLGLVQLRPSGVLAVK